MSGFTIGKAAKQAGVGVETVRFYERRGLIEQPPRRDNGYRQYPEETVVRIRFIKQAKKLGFTLREINELLTPRDEPGAACSDLRQRAEIKLMDINRRIEELARMRDVLNSLINSCSQEKSIGECPILNVITGEETE